MSEQLSVCKALAAMIRQHGAPTEDEVHFIAHSALELALTPEQNKAVQQVLKEGGDFAAELGGVTSKPMRLYLFRRVVAASLIDEKIEDHELAIIHSTSKAFGFNDAAVTDYLAWMKQGIAWEKQGVEISARL